MLPIDQAVPSSNGSRTDVAVINVICNAYTERAAASDSQLMHRTHASAPSLIFQSDSWSDAAENLVAALGGRGNCALSLLRERRGEDSHELRQGQLNCSSHTNHETL